MALTFDILLPTQAISGQPAQAQLAMKNTSTAVTITQVDKLATGFGGYGTGGGPLEGVSVPASTITYVNFPIVAAGTGSAVPENWTEGLIIHCSDGSINVPTHNAQTFTVCNALNQVLDLPQAVTTLVATPGTTTAGLTWVLPANSASVTITGFEIISQAVGGSGFADTLTPLTFQHVSSGTATSATVLNLVANVTYNISVYAICAAGYGINATVSCAQT